MNNYSEQIFQSIDTIISQRLNEVKFDKTITCEIIAGVKDYPNKYWVSDGATKFQACVADSSRTYIAGQKVYVLIPNGNYNSADKVIIGSYTAAELPKNLYTNPFDHLVYSSKISFTTDNEYIETSTDTESLVSMILPNIAFNYSNTTPFDYIGLDFSFNTTNLYGMKKGNYGIQFTLKNKDTEIFTSAIDSSQLYGDIYNFNSLMKMQHLFPIPVGVDITQANELVINLYQKGNFDIAKKKIYLKGASFYFGYDVEKINSNKLILHLDKSQSLTFKENEDEEKLKRKLYLEWQDTDLNKIYSFDQEQPSSEKYSYTIYWCKYIPGYKKGNGDIEETGVYWKTIEINSFSQEVKLKPQYNTQQFKVGIKYRNEEEKKELVEQQAEEINAIIQDTSLTNEEKQKKITEIEEKYKKLIDALWKYLESNVLIFTNEDVKPEPGSTNNSEDSIKLTCSDSGVYNYYTSYGKIIDSKYKNLERTITASFLDGYDIADTTTNVKWSIVGIDETNQKSTMINQKTATNNLFTFTIKDNYIPGIKDQNTILCEATLSNGEIRRGKITLRFGEANSAGSQYAFNIDFPDNVNCLYIGDTTPIEIKYTFESRSGDKVEEPTIIWSWLDDTDHGDITLNTNTGTLIAPSIMPAQNHAVLVATIEDYPLNNGLQTDLKAYLPIPLSADRNKYQYMSGPTYLVYDSTGSAVLNYSKENYVLYPTDDSETWRAEDYTPNTPQLSFKKGKWYLQPLALAPNNLPVTCLKAIKDPAGDNTIIWSQPIFSTRERWDMDALNNWNGTFLQDTEKNRLFAATIAAGGKNAEDNTFSGVLMGQSLDPTNKTLEETGLYGIDKGIVKYYLNNAGAFFVGDGDNYISFNDAVKGKEFENSLRIKTDNFYLSAGNNLLIDSKVGISLGNKLKLNIDGTASIAGWAIEEGKISASDIENKYNVYVASSGQWAFFSKGPRGEFKVGFYGDMTATSGTIAGWEIGDGFLRNKDSQNRYVGLGLFGKTYAFFAGGKEAGGSDGVFRVGHDGALTATSATIEGSIKASTGTIGGWKIDTNKIYNKNSTTGYTFTLWNPGIAGGTIISCDNGNDYPFYVNRDGSLHCSNATIKGTIQADVGYFGDFKIGRGRGPNLMSASGFTGEGGTAPYRRYLSWDPGWVYATTEQGGDDLFRSWTAILAAAVSSDEKIKNNITSLNSEKLENFYNKIQPKSFYYNSGYGNPLEQHYGVIAQDIIKAEKECNINDSAIVFHDLDQPLAVRYNEFIALNTWQIQKLKQRVTELENEIKEIKQNENN